MRTCPFIVPLTVLIAMALFLPRVVAADEPATAPSQGDRASAPAPADPLQTVKAYHALFLRGEVKQGVEEHFDLDQIMREIFEEDYANLSSADRQRLREQFFPAMEPVMSHPAMRDAIAKSTFGKYESRSRPNERATVEFVQAFPNGQRRSGWIALRYFDGRWRIIDVGTTGSGGFVSTLRTMWKRVRHEATPVAFFEQLAVEAQRLMKQQPGPRQP